MFSNSQAFTYSIREILKKLVHVVFSLAPVTLYVLLG